MTIAPSCSRLLIRIQREGAEEASVDSRPLDAAHHDHLVSTESAELLNYFWGQRAELYSLSDWYKISPRSLQLVRSPGSSPVFQTLFVLQNVPQQELALSGLAATAADLERPTAGATFDLTLSLKETGGMLRGALEFNAALFDFSTIERMASDFGTLLTSVVQNPDAPVAGALLAAHST